MKTSENMNTFAKLVSNIVGETITNEHIHVGTGRYYYIQPAVDGAPMLLRHYRGPLFIDMSKNDYNGIVSGTIDAEEYVMTANWMVGYYWGGGTMIGSGSYGGAFYQPIDIVNRSEEVKRYIRILSCRTHRQSSGYRPTAEACENCSIKNCPFSSAESNRGEWENETIKEEDPRHEIFKLLSEKFETQFPGYSLKGFLCSFEDGNMQSNESFVRANTRFQEADGYTFMVYLSAETIRGLLMHTISIDDAKEIVEGITFYHSEWGMDGTPEVTLDSIKKIFEKPGMDYPAENAAKKAKEEADLAEAKRIAAERAKWGIFGFVYDMLHK